MGSSSTVVAFGLESTESRFCCSSRWSSALLEALAPNDLRENLHFHWMAIMSGLIY